MKTEIVAKKTIKASSPTPKTFNLCVVDQVSPPVYTKLYFFYKNTSTDDLQQVIAKRIHSLKSSLAEVLTCFYPFVGRIRDQCSVRLEEDDGAEFVEARVDCTLLDYLEKPIPEMLLQLVPKDFWEVDPCPLLMVQATIFKCGGLAIGMNFSHKVSDACTFAHFINSWADTAIGKSDKVKTPNFSGSQLFPALEELYLVGDEIGEVVKVNEKTKRFVFPGPKIVALQKTIFNEIIQRTSRLETITNFIWRIGQKMVTKRAGGSAVSSVLITPINIRRMLPPPICDKTFGNLVETQIVPNDSRDIELSHLISLYRKQVTETSQAYVKNFDRQQFMERFMGIGEKMMELMPQPDVKNAFTISSWSKFPFYEADFGWGKPIWVATHNPMPYITILMDTRDGMGIEAWVNLPEEEMAIFGSDEELLTYAVPDPSAL